MPMIGGEWAAEAALASRPVPADGEAYDLGWVTDWLYGEASLPPAPLPVHTPAHRQLVPLRAEPSVFAGGGAEPPAPPRRPARRGRRARQLALL